LELESGEYFKKKARTKSERADESKKAEGREIVSNLRKLNKAQDQPPAEESRANPVLTKKLNEKKRKFVPDDPAPDNH
jgi:hypothetical protein